MLEKYARSAFGFYSAQSWHKRKAFKYPYIKKQPQTKQDYERLEAAEAKRERKRQKQLSDLRYRYNIKR